MMKKCIALALLVSLNISCNGQNNKNETKPKNEEKKPLGDWTVNKQYDDKGNLIQYDSIYSWSSSSGYNNLSDLEKDSLLHSYKSKFFSSLHSFPTPQHIDSIFMDSFFTDDFFSSDFGEDFMQLDKIRNRMLQQQQQFFKKYSSKVEPKESEKTKL
ncbi:hypothetical protein PBN93_14310 [Cellulophaga omnivescoria]|nr:hypothetical protein [Cellulophaga omnivescoria]WBU89034.1 hypothetical protein PBN93_14310 [Cellulophaga omnivescoria]